MEGTASTLVVTRDPNRPLILAGPLGDTTEVMGSRTAIFSIPSSSQPHNYHNERDQLIMVVLVRCQDSESGLCKVRFRVRVLEWGRR